MLRELARNSPQTVGEVAAGLRVSLPAASQGLRAMEARGLLVVRRSGREVCYRLNLARDGMLSELVRSLQSGFKRGSIKVNSLFRLATAFTHPRRIAIYRAVRVQPSTGKGLQLATQISEAALTRHLRKLIARGLVRLHRGRYLASFPRCAVARALTRLVS